MILNFLADDLISYHDSVFGRPTSFVPFSNATKVFRDLDHMATKDQTPDTQYQLVTTYTFWNIKYLIEVIYSEKSGPKFSHCI